MPKLKTPIFKLLQKKRQKKRQFLENDNKTPKLKTPKKTPKKNAQKKNASLTTIGWGDVNFPKEIPLNEISENLKFCSKK